MTPMSTTSNVRLLRGRPQPRVAEPLPSLPSSLSPTSDKVYTPGSDSSPMLPTFLVRLISATFNRYKTRPSDEHLSFFNCKCALISVTSEELSLTEIKAKVRYHNRIREIKSVGLSGLIDEEVSFENFMFLVMTSLGVEPEKETRTERSLPTCFTNTKRERWGNTARESEKQEDEPNLGRETTEAFAKLMWNSLDKNNLGAVNWREFERMLEKVVPIMSRKRGKEIYQAMDMNGIDQVTKSNFMTSCLSDV